MSSIFMKNNKKRATPVKRCTYDISPYPTVVMVTTAHQNPSGIDWKWDSGDPASEKYTVLEKSITPVKN